jgi:hypothetical protein
MGETRCIDCDPGSRRPADYPGPRCATHHYASQARPIPASAERKTCTYCKQPLAVGVRRDTVMHAACRKKIELENRPWRKCDYCNEDIQDRKHYRYHPKCKVKFQEETLDSYLRCGKCRKSKPAEDFSSDSTRANGKFPWCMTCQVQYAAGQKFQDPEAPLNGKTCPLCDTPIRGPRNRTYCSTKCKDRTGSLRKKFNLPVGEYRRLVTAANGRCPICSKRTREWHVDHNHRTNKITGVVCARCNVTLLAASLHSVELAQNLLSYLTITPAEALGIEAFADPAQHKPSQLDAIWSHRSRKSR